MAGQHHPVQRDSNSILSGVLLWPLVLRRRSLREGVMQHHLQREWPLRWVIVDSEKGVLHYWLPNSDPSLSELEGCLSRLSTSVHTSRHTILLCRSLQCESAICVRPQGGCVWFWTITDCVHLPAPDLNIDGRGLYSQSIIWPLLCQRALGSGQAASEVPTETVLALQKCWLSISSFLICYTSHIQQAILIWTCSGHTWKSPSYLLRWSTSHVTRHQDCCGSQRESSGACRRGMLHTGQRRDYRNSMVYGEKKGGGCGPQVEGGVPQVNVVRW